MVSTLYFERRPVYLKEKAALLLGIDESAIDACFAYALERPERLEPYHKPTNQPQPKFWLQRFE